MGCHCSKTRPLHAPSIVLYEVQLRSSYNEACRLLPELRPFAIAAATTSNSELNEVISDNPDLLYLIKEYFNNTIKALKLLAALKRSLATPKPKEYYFDIAGELRQACEQQKAMLMELDLRKRKVGKKVRSMKTWRKVWRIACGAAFAAALICSVLFAVLGAPHAACATAVAASVAVKAVEEWLDLVWRGREDVLKGEREVVTKMYMDTFSVIHELDRKFINREDGEFIKSVGDLGRQVDLCTSEMGRTLAECLKIITNEM